MIFFGGVNRKKVRVKPLYIPSIWAFSSDISLDFRWSEILRTACL